MEFYPKHSLILGRTELPRWAQLDNCARNAALGQGMQGSIEDDFRFYYWHSFQDENNAGKKKRSRE